MFVLFVECVFFFYSDHVRRDMLSTGEVAAWD